jgi:hypothetical protein
MPYTEMIDECRRAGQHTWIANTSIGAVYMPTTFMISNLKPKKELPITNTAEASEVVDEVLDDYEILFNDPEEFVASGQQPRGNV